MNEETKDIIIEKAKAGFPALLLLTSEDQRAQKEVKAAAEELKRPMFVWTLGKGLRSTEVSKGGGEYIQNTAAPGQVLEYILTYAKEMQERREKAMGSAKGAQHPDANPKGGVFLLRVMHSFLSSPPVQALILDLIPVMKMTKVAIILTSPSQALPPELEKEFSTIEMKLPSKDMLTKVFDGLVLATGLTPPTAEVKKSIIDSATGLATSEAENTFSLSIVRPKRQNKPIWDPSVVLEEKVVALRKSGLLEYIATENITMQSVGGMKALKGWVSLRKRAFTEEARVFGLPPPKGILMVGPPGSGKSLGAKAVGAELGIPLIRCDFGKLLGSLVGQSEANLRRALDAAEAMAPCVFWIDEIEKALAGSSGSNDSGVGARLLGHLLTWMQEKTSPVFVYATANDVTGLPPELLRKGRFDEMWSVLLPNEEERAEIFRIHLMKRNRGALLDAKKNDKLRVDIEDLVEKTKGFSGAEIEAVVVEAMYEAFNSNREMNGLDMVTAVKRVVPLFKTMSHKIIELEKWCKTRTRAANGEEDSNIKAVLESIGGRLVEA